MCYFEFSTKLANIQHLALIGGADVSYAARIAAEKAIQMAVTALRPGSQSGPAEAIANIQNALVAVCSSGPFSGEKKHNKKTHTHTRTHRHEAAVFFLK